MKKRYVVFGMSVVLAVSLAVPALGGPSNPAATISAGAKKIAKQALKAAQDAQNSANQAQDSANQAQTTATQAQNTANQANTAAQAAQTAANNAQAAADAAQATANNKLDDPSFQAGDTVGPNAATTKTSFAICPDGTSVTGGGFTMGGTDPHDAVPTLSSPYFNSWVAAAREIGGNTATNWSLTANALCATNPDAP
jgi:hypothetical protein